MTMATPSFPFFAYPRAYAPHEQDCLWIVGELGTRSESIMRRHRSKSEAYPALFLGAYQIQRGVHEGL